MFSFKQQKKVKAIYSPYTGPCPPKNIYIYIEMYYNTQVVGSLISLLKFKTMVQIFFSKNNRKSLHIT